MSKIKLTKARKTLEFLAKLIRPSLKLRSYINSELKEHKATHKTDLLIFYSFACLSHHALCLRSIVFGSRNLSLYVNRVK